MKRIIGRAVEAVRREAEADPGDEPMPRTWQIHFLGFSLSIEVTIWPLESLKIEMLFPWGRNRGPYNRRDHFSLLKTRPKLRESTRPRSAMRRPLQRGGETGSSFREAPHVLTPY